jgi:hypothetical protein
MLFQLWKFVHNSKNREILTWTGGGAAVIAAQPVRADAGGIATGGNVRWSTISGGVLGAVLLSFLLLTLGIRQDVERRDGEDRQGVEANAAVVQTEQRREEARQSAEAIEAEMRRANAEVARRRVDQAEAEQLRAAAAEDLRRAEATEKQTRAEFEAARQLFEEDYLRQQERGRLRREAKEPLDRLSSAGSRTQMDAVASALAAETREAQRRRDVAVSRSDAARRTTVEARRRFQEAEAAYVNFQRATELASDDYAKMRARGDKLKALSVGRIVLFAPKNMKVGDTRQVDAKVGLGVPSEELQKNARSGDQELKDFTRISAQMAAILVGQGFKITALSPEQQTIAEGFPTVWSWNVEAAQSGEQGLEATLYALLPGDASTPRQRVDSYAQIITVNVREKTWGEWFEAFGHQFDVAKSIVVALFGVATVAAGWLGISFTRRKKANAAGEDLPGVVAPQDTQRRGVGLRAAAAKAGPPGPPAVSQATMRLKGSAAPSRAAR